MAKEDLNNLGLGDDNAYQRIMLNEGDKEKGFVAGTRVKPSKQWFT